MIHRAQESERRWANSMSDTGLETDPVPPTALTEPEQLAHPSNEVSNLEKNVRLGRLVQLSFDA
jgi:hypothetical protein